MDAEETEKQEEKKAKKVTPILGGALENGQEVVPPLFSQKSGFSKSSKTLFYSVSRKMGGNHFFQKGYVTRRTDLEGKKNKTLWCILYITV